MKQVICLLIFLCIFTYSLKELNRFFEIILFKCYFCQLKEHLYVPIRVKCSSRSFSFVFFSKLFLFFDIDRRSNNSLWCLFFFFASFFIIFFSSRRWGYIDCFYFRIITSFTKSGSNHIAMGIRKAIFQDKVTICVSIS